MPTSSFSSLLPVASDRAIAAAEALSNPTSPDGVVPGTYVRVHLARVAPPLALALLARHEAASQVLCCIKARRLPAPLHSPR